MNIYLYKYYIDYSVLYIIYISSSSSKKKIFSKLKLYVCLGTLYYSIFPKKALFFNFLNLLKSDYLIYLYQEKSIKFPAKHLIKKNSI